MPKRQRLTAKQREDLWDAEYAKSIEAKRGEYPICNICDLPVTPGQTWHDSHNKYWPHAVGGQRDGIAHARCNLRHNNIHDTPLVAKVKRQRQGFIRARESRRPVVGSRASGIKVFMDGRPPVYRDSGRPVFERRKG